MTRGGSTAQNRREASSFENSHHHSQSCKVAKQQTKEGPRTRGPNKGMRVPSSPSKRPILTPNVERTLRDGLGETIIMTLSTKYWTSVAKSRFRDMLFRAREEAKAQCKTENIEDTVDSPPEWINADIWRQLVAIWAKDKWRNKFEKGKVNRGTEFEGSIVRHTAGSISFLRHKKILAGDLKRKPTHLEFFDRTHKRSKGKGDFVDKRSRVAHDRYQKAISRQGSDSSTQQESFDADAWCEATGEPSRGRVYGFSIYKLVSSIMPQYASQRHIGVSRYCSMIEEEVQQRVEIVCLDLKTTVNAQHEQQDKIMAELREMRELLCQAYESRATVPEGDNSSSAWESNTNGGDQNKRDRGSSH
ncbi:putative transposase-like protein [Apostasia shenzhenica]|uniref:Putative transposase-like protein n=1 Tax=Apostasia shenzhenica TaxID=1088818 RepID=A0A2H9ZW96_9ASPA|nr:putative transposase-like protein [Apostasia shenzhenica]